MIHGVIYHVTRLLTNNRLLSFFSTLYNFIFSPSLIIGNGFQINGAFLRRVKIKVHGKQSQVIICPKVMMNDSVISVVGDNCKVYIDGGGTNIHHCYIGVKGNGSEVVIKKGFTTEQVSLHACEGRKIIIDEDCMFSANIDISTTDFHSVLDANTGERVNPAKDIIIGKHVWHSYGVNILKGAVIPDHVIVGKNSVVVGKLTQPFSVYAGMPAKMVKNGVDWKRSL